MTLTLATPGTTGTCKAPSITVVGEVGEIDTTWVARGLKRSESDVIGVPPPEPFHRAPSAGRPVVAR